MKKEVGKELGVTDWLQIDQERINQVADCTLDHQWIHVDQEASAKGPFGKTSLVIQTIRKLKEKFRIGIMEADIDSMVDAEKVAGEGVAAIQIRNGGFISLAGLRLIPKSSRKRHAWVFTPIRASAI